MPARKQGPGRPPKYGRPSRALTVTLPEDVIARLSASDPDIGRAIVTLTERRGRLPRHRPASAELSNFGNRAVITIQPARALKRIAGVQLVPIGNGRALIALEPPRTIPEFELQIRDALENDNLPPHERVTLEGVADILHSARLSRRTRLEARTIIVLESRSAPRKPTDRTQ